MSNQVDSSTFIFGQRLNRFGLVGCVLIFSGLVPGLAPGLLSGLGLDFAQAQSVSIQLKGVKRPAQDLLDKTGRNLDVGEAAGRIELGEDLSLLNPMPGQLWQNRSFPASPVADDRDRETPPGKIGVTWMYTEASNANSYMAMHMGRVQSNADRSQFYRLTISRNVHAALLRAALLRRLGYFIPSPRFYQDLRVTFKNEKEKEEFLTNAQSEMGTDFESRKWVTRNDPSDHSITLASAVLEPASAEYYDLAWGFAPPANDPKQSSRLQRLNRYRTYRALLLVNVLTDIPESLNRYSPKACSIRAGHAVLSYPFAESFAGLAVEDARWIMRRLFSLTENDLREVVNESQVPESFKNLVYAKLVHRIANLSECLGITDLFKLNKPDLQMNSADGLVVAGKVTAEFVAGYPVRWSHGDRTSPYSDGDMGKYLRMGGISSALGSFLSRVNEKLQLATVEEAARSYQQEKMQKVMAHFKAHPNQPYDQQVQSWGGLLAGVNVSAKRHVGTGTYFGSTASVQLVDNLSFTGNLGLFQALDGVIAGTVPLTPVAGVNLGLTRSYTHVRPINTITEGSQESWKKLLIPRFMNRLSSILDSGDDSALSEGTAKTAQKAQQHPVDQFIQELREGEVFMISDSITVGGYAQISSPIDLLMGVSPFSFMNSVSFGADANRVILAQTVISKTSDGIHVYFRRERSNVLGVQFDFNYFINVLRFRAQNSHLVGQTDAFVIDYDSDYVSALKPDDQASAAFFKTREDLRLALRPLFRSNDAELVYGKFKHRKFVLDHDIRTKEQRLKFLALRATGFSEGKLLTIKPPASDNRADLRPEENAVSLYSYRRGELVGRDLLGLATELVNGLFKRNGTNLSWSGSEDPNPANTPFGQSFWRVVDSQVDVSTHRTPKYSVSSQLQRVWGGWSIKREEFFKLVDEIEESLKGTSIAPYRLIEKEAFLHVKKLDFYRITAQLSLLESGIAKLRDLIRQPETDGQGVPKAQWAARVFQKLSGGPARLSDRKLFEEVVKILGVGDYQKGHAAYLRICQEAHNAQSGSSESAGLPPNSWYKGSFYECLDPWMQKLIDLGRNYPSQDRVAQARWATQVLWELDSKIPLPMLLRYLGEENYIFFVRVNGFRTGDEDADLEFFSNTIGQPPNSFEYSNGLINHWSARSRILPIEMDRSQGGVR